MNYSYLEEYIPPAQRIEQGRGSTIQIRRGDNERLAEVADQLRMRKVDLITTILNYLEDEAERHG